MLNIEAIYHEYLQKENNLNREKYKEFEGWFSASTAGSCFKKSMFRREGVDEPEFDRRVMRLLRLGTVVHTDIQTAISDAWNSENDLFELFIEKQVKIPELNLVGHLDLALHNRTSNQLKVWDIKTCAGYKWKMMFGRKPNPKGSPGYNLQLGTYAYALSKELKTDDVEMALLWYNKDTSAVREQYVDNRWMDDAMDYWEELNSHTEDGIKADEMVVGSYGIPMENWECKYCNFKDIHCKGI